MTNHLKILILEDNTYDGEEIMHAWSGAQNSFADSERRQIELLICRRSMNFAPPISEAACFSRDITQRKIMEQEIMELKMQEQFTPSL